MTLTRSPFPHPVRTEWKMLVQLRVDNPGISLAECARSLGVSAQSVRMWVKQPLYQSFENYTLQKDYEYTPLENKRARADMKVELDAFAVEMFDRLKDIVETTGDEKLLKEIAFDALDRAGYAEPKRETQRPINLILTPELFEQLRLRSAEAAGDASLTVVDGETVQP